MRRIDSFKDTADALREVWFRLDQLSSQNLDMRKRRVVNATPSRDLYDCVVRKELDEKIATVTQQVQTAAVSAGKKYYTVVFSNPGFPAAEDFASPHFIVQKPGTVKYVKVVALSPPIGVDAIFDIWINETLILDGELHIPADSADSVVYETSSFDPINPTVVSDDLINVKVIQTGKVGKVTVEVWIEES